MSSDDDGHDGSFYRFGRPSRRDDRTIKSSKLPRAIKELEEDDPIDDKDILDGPESGAHKIFHGIQGTPCIMSATASPNDQWLPANALVDRMGVHLSFKIHGGLVAKQFSITAKVAGSNVSKLHQSKLQFFLGQRGQMENFEYSKKTFEDAGNVFGRPTTAYIMGWTTYGGYGSGLEVAADYDGEAVATFSRMESLTRSVLTGKTTIVLMVADTAGLANELQAIQAEVIQYKTPWFPYLDGRGVPACSWARFPKRLDVKAECGGLVPIPAQNSFTTITEAFLMLSNGICLEYRVSPKNDPRAAWPSSEENQTYLKFQLIALRELWLDESGRWWPVVLNQSSPSLSIYDPLESMEALHGDIQELWKTMQTAFPWDAYQQQALMASRKLRGRVGIVEGGPGSGKTTTLAGIAAAYACSGCPVLLFAPTIPQAKALAEAVTTLLGHMTAKASSDAYSNPWDREFDVVKLFPGEMDLDDVESDPGEYAEMIAEADIVIALPYAICSEALVCSFGAKSSKFLVIHDDAHQLTESEIWATIFSLSERQHCRGLIMSTDIKEWPLDIATLAPLEKKCAIKAHRHYQEGFQWMFASYLQHVNNDRKLPRPFHTIGPCEFAYSGGVNEFAEQTSLALVSRLLRQGFPSVMLKNQHRMREALIEIPNKFVYKTNPLQYVLGPLGQADTERFHDLLRKWLGVRLGAKTEGKDMSVVFLEASHGKSVCIKERNTTNSKRNHRNVDVVYDLIVRNHRAKAMNVNDIKIVTQYKDQARLYGLEYDNRAKESGIQGRCLPQVVTLDTLRGHEAKVIIYDLVVTCGDKEHGLGIVNNELRACIAATRASDTLIIVGSRELVTTFPDFWSWMNRRTGASDNPLPLIVRYAKALRNAGLSFEPPTEKREACPFGLKKEWFSKETGFMPWEWTRNNTSGERE